jgi:hypothetical protein
MKKLLYILAIVSASAIAFTSCTEENIKPTAKSEAAGGGGGSYDPE